VFLLYEAIRRHYFSTPLGTVFLLSVIVGGQKFFAVLPETNSLRLVFVKFSSCDDIIIYKATGIFVWKSVGVGCCCNFVSNYMLQNCYGVDMVKDY
jgi:hypothetical protein